MELTHLKYFIAVAEELHFGRAATRLHMAQPPLSQQIQRLEDELEVKLFNRTSRRVELSAAGKIFLAEARGIVNKADEVKQIMRKLGHGQSGYLSVAFNEPAINTFLPDAVREFMRKYPEVQLTLNQLEISEQFRELTEQRIHLGFMRPFGYDITAFEKRLVMRENYVLALPSQHPLCSESIIRLELLSDVPLIIFPQSEQPYLRKSFEECFESAGLQPNIVQELSSKRTTLALVKAGIGAGFVPESSMVYAPEGIEFRHLDGNLPPIEIFAVWRPGIETSLITNFLDLVPSMD